MQSVLDWFGHEGSALPHCAALMRMQEVPCVVIGRVTFRCEAIPRLFCKIHGIYIYMFNSISAAPPTINKNGLENPHSEHVLTQQK